MNKLEMLFNDEQTAVDCKLLHQNLGLSKSNWNKWIKNNVINNEFLKKVEIIPRSYLIRMEEKKLLTFG